MYTDTDWTRAISKLTRLTVQGSIKWKIADEFSPSDERYVDQAFYSYIEARTYVVYRFRYRYYTDEDTFHWEYSIALEIWDGGPMDYFRLKLARAPDVPALRNLYETVQRRFASEQNLLGFLLSDDEAPGSDD